MIDIHLFNPRKGEIEGSTKPAMVAEWLLLWDYQLEAFQWN